MRDLEKRLFPSLLGLLLCCACEGDTYDILDIEVPGGYELSAGTALYLCVPLRHTTPRPTG